MKLFSTAATAALIVAAAAAASPVLAQGAARPAAPAPQRAYKFSKEERAALQPIQAAITAKDWAKATGLLPAAQAAAQGADAKYALGQFQLQIGIGTNDEAMQARAIDALIASGGAPAADLPALYRNQGALALKANNLAGAEAAFNRLVELTPNDPEILVNLARIKNDQKKPQEAATLMLRAIDARRAAGQIPDQTWYQYGLKIAYDNRLRTEGLKFGRGLITAYPTPVNWRSALLVYRRLNTLDKGGAIDLLRLMRASKALEGESDWFELADSLGGTGLPGEEQAVLQEGGQLHMIDLNKAAFRELLSAANSRVPADKASLAGIEPKALAASTGTIALNTADAYLGYANYPKAIALYRAALGKSGVDPNVVNTRLGIALALSGDRPGAEAAFKAVTGPRADIAGFWLTWLAQRG
jgi:tetratricopeptide (TPR) repeat protein